jgi:hypothetical protein
LIAITSCGLRGPNHECWSRGDKSPCGNVNGHYTSLSRSQTNPSASRGSTQGRFGGGAVTFSPQER